MRNRLKIAIYSGEIPSTTFVERLIVGLAQEGHSILLFGKRKKKIAYNNGCVYQVSFKESKLSKLLFLAKYTFLLFFFRKRDKKELDAFILAHFKNQRVAKIKCYPVLWHKPDVFHVQWAKSVADWVWVQRFGIKLVVSLRGAHINYSPVTEIGLAAHYRLYFPKVDGFHAVSKAIAKEAVKYGATPANIKVVYSGFPLSKTLPTFESTSASSKILLLSVGRSHWKKGYNYALDACSFLKSQGVAFHYTIIGAKGVEELEYQKNDLGLADCVTFIDKVPYATVLQMMHEAHVVLLPSVEEGIANVVLEAMMLRKIVLTTDCGGMEEIVQDGTNGFVMPIRNPQVMSEKIIAISTLNEEENQSITSNARNTIETMNSEEKMVTDMIALYNFVLKTPTDAFTSK
ncbi:glycosyltransferase family 4 protein [Flavobacterium sp. SM2513]|uniref:glycosyltransferase family 4 protein n=1 Tax=Flavobacterium sp. SM2513 TaxID=3424766 RepID=UPI003D7F67D7